MNKELKPGALDNYINDVQQAGYDLYGMWDAEEDTLPLEKAISNGSLDKTHWSRLIEIEPKKVIRKLHEMRVFGYTDEEIARFLIFYTEDEGDSPL